jgi:serine protease Do
MHDISSLFLRDQSTTTARARRAPLWLALAAGLALAGQAVAVPEPLWTEGPSAAGLRDDAPLQFGSFAKLARELSPAVVSIRTVVAGRTVFGAAPIGEGQGSGFIINPKGYILTNAHVIEKAAVIQVMLEDGRELEAHVVGIDPPTDLALLKVDAREPLPAVSLGDSKALEVGEWVMAIGNPLGLDHTVTVGIVSAKGRRNLHPGNRDLYENFIQTDASINPGNSGGPLFNIRGEVVGINTAINPHGQGIGFAIPIHMAKALIPMLLEGRVQRSWLGVMIQPVSREMARSFGLDKPAGALVAEVVTGGPADRAGLKPGDLILRFDDAPLQSHDELPWIASTSGVDKVADVEVLRGSERKTLRVKLGSKPDDAYAAAPAARPAPPAPAPPKRGGAGAGGAGGADGLGLVVSELTPSVAAQLGLSAGEGVLIEDIEPGSPARGTMLRKGDVVLQVDDVPVRSIQGFKDAVKRLRSGDIVRLRLQRGDARLFVAFNMP